MRLIEEVVKIVSIIIFRDVYLDGFCEKTDKKDKYILTPLFPNEETMRVADKYIEQNI